MASSSSWLNTCLFYSLLEICSRLSSLVQEFPWQTQLLLPSCLLGSSGTHLMPWFLGALQWEMQMSFITAIAFFPSHTMKGADPRHPWGKVVQILKDFVKIRKYCSGFYFTSSLWSEVKQREQSMFKREQSMIHVFMFYGNTSKLFFFSHRDFFLNLN